MTKIVIKNMFVKYNKNMNKNKLKTTKITSIDKSQN